MTSHLNTFFNKKRRKNQLVYVLTDKRFEWDKEKDSSVTNKQDKIFEREKKKELLNDVWLSILKFRNKQF